MTHPPNGSAAPPGHRGHRHAQPHPRCRPYHRSPALRHPPTGPETPRRLTPPAHTLPPAPPRRTAWAEGVDTLRTAATTEPGRLRIIGAVLALLVVAFGAVTAWQMTDRSAAADDVLNSSQPLSASAADIYRSLADANTAASSGFLAGGQETEGVPHPVRGGHPGRPPTSWSRPRPTRSPAPRPRTPSPSSTNCCRSTRA